MASFYAAAAAEAAVALAVAVSCCTAAVEHEERHLARDLVSESKTKAKCSTS